MFQFLLYGIYPKMLIEHGCYPFPGNSLKCRNPKAHLGVGSLDDGRRADLRGSEPGKGIAVLRPAQFSGFG